MSINRIGTNDSVNLIKEIYRNLDRELKNNEVKNSKGTQPQDLSFKEILGSTASKGEGVSRDHRAEGSAIERPTFSKVPDEANGLEVGPSRESVVAFAREAVSRSADVRNEKVRTISEKISRGEYHIRAEDVAQSLLASHVFDDLI